MKRENYGQVELQDTRKWHTPLRNNKGLEPWLSHVSQLTFEKQDSCFSVLPQLAGGFSYFPPMLQLFFEVFF